MNGDDSMARCRQPRGYLAWRSHPMSRRQRLDLVVLAHIREEFRLSLGSYALRGSRLPANHESDRPRMTEELKELGLDVATAASAI